MNIVTIIIDVLAGVYAMAQCVLLLSRDRGGDCLGDGIDLCQ